MARLKVTDVKVSIDEGLTKNVQMVLNDPEFKISVHDLFKKKMEPYVPMKRGNLSQTVTVTADGVTYTMPYAHYMYEGELYLAANGSSWARRGETKKPSGKPLSYSKLMHPLATHHWDQAMMKVKGEEFAEEIKQRLIRRYKQLW